jgi:hypothetical protein
MAGRQITDRGNGLYVWRIAGNILNKHALQADKGLSSRLGFGRGANTPRLRKPARDKLFPRTCKMNGIWNLVSRIKRRT